jgi:hydrogenase maturation factor HypE
MNKILVTAKDAATATVCIVALYEGVVDQIMNAINFEEIKARAIVVILRKEARGAQLNGIVEKGKAQDGKVDGHDCLIRGYK